MIRTLSNSLPVVELPNDFPSLSTTQFEAFFPTSRQDRQPGTISSKKRTGRTYLRFPTLFQFLQPNDRSNSIHRYSEFATHRSYYLCVCRIFDEDVVNVSVVDLGLYFVGERRIRFERRIQWEWLRSTGSL